jgi:hypothetical protein
MFCEKCGWATDRVGICDWCSDEDKEDDQCTFDAEVYKRALVMGAILWASFAFALCGIVYWYGG